MIFSLSESEKSNKRSILIYYHGGAYCILSPGLLFNILYKIDNYLAILYKTYTVHIYQS
jgi:hypothetical protein